jgi:ubiquinone/menaquinone biosynthesis C-methylase UbiE
VIPEPTALARITAAMDYDQSDIATTYDEARALTPARRRRWQRLLSAHLDRSTISPVVDLGCGTGRFSEMLAAELGARVIGLDPSKKMIDLARRKPATSPVVFGRASAHELPLPEGRVDLLFTSFLARLSDTEFDQGMAALRAYGANINSAEAITEEIDWFVFTKRA